MRTGIAVLSLVLILLTAAPARAGVGDKLPDLAGVDLSETRTKLSALGDPKATATVVVVWASWCGKVCDQTAVKVEALAKSRPWLRVVIVVPLEGDTAGSIRSGLVKARLTSPALLVDERAMAPLKIEAVPVIAVVDAGGVFRFWQVNLPKADEWSAVEQALDALAPGGAPAAPVAAPPAPKPTVPVACSKKFLDKQVAKGLVTALDLRRVARELGEGAPVSGEGDKDSQQRYDDGRRASIDRLKALFAKVELYDRSPDGVAQVDLAPGDLLVYRLPWKSAGAVMVVKAFDRTTGVAKVVIHNEMAAIGKSPAEQDPDGKEKTLANGNTVREFPEHLGGRVANEVYRDGRELLIVYRGTREQSYTRPGLFQLRPISRALCK